MRISEIDKNLKIETSLPEQDIMWFTANENPFRLYGSHDPQGDKPYHRLPERVAQETNEGVAVLHTNTAGVRVRFATDSPYIAIKAEWPEMCRVSHMPFSGSSGFDLYRCQHGHQQFLRAYIPPLDADTGFEGIQYPPGNGMREYILGFPLYNAVDALYIGVKAGSTLTAGVEQYHNDKPVVFYGSSITQGGCASRPGNCYQGFLSQALNMEYRNLGFSGSARGERAIVEYMAGLDMAAFVCDYDHNAPNADHLEQTHYQMYETIRRAHPTLPYIMVTHPTPYISEPERRRAVIMESYLKARATGDENVYFIDGDSFTQIGAGCDTVDGCHPTDLGFYFMAQGMMRLLEKILYE